jgi:hypothetical protein
MTGFGINNASEAQNFKRAIAKNLGMEDENFAESLKISFAGGSLDSKQLGESPSKSGAGFLENQPLSKRVLGLVLSYINDRQQAYQNGKFVRIDKTDFKNSAVQDISKHYQVEINKLYKGIGITEALKISTKIHKSDGNFLVFSINKNLEKAQVFLQNSENLENKNTFNLKIYPTPTMYQGMNANLKQGSILLFADNGRMAKKDDWQVVAILNSTLEEIKIGFIYGHIFQQNFTIQTSENQVFINNQAVKTTYKIDKTQQFFRFLALIFIFIFVFFLFWRGR